MQFTKTLLFSILWTFNQNQSPNFHNLTSKTRSQQRTNNYFHYGLISSIDPCNSELLNQLKNSANKLHYKFITSTSTKTTPNLTQKKKKKKKRQTNLDNLQRTEKQRSNSNTYKDLRATKLFNTSNYNFPIACKKNWIFIIYAKKKKEKKRSNSMFTLSFLPLFLILTSTVQPGGSQSSVSAISEFSG